MSDTMQRRSFLKAAVLGAVSVQAITLATRSDAAAPLPALDPNDATAKALGYVPDATKVDAKARPNYKPGQKCGNCVQFQGKATDAEGACNLFAGKGVKGAGWCSVWAQKPGA
jgi:hypothetical protein